MTTEVPANVAASGEPPSAAPKRPEAGFVLVLVLWLTGLFAVAVAVFAKAVVTDIRIAGNTSASAEAEALAEAGVSLAILDLLQTSGRRTATSAFGRDGTDVFACRLGGGIVTVAVQDIGGRVDINAAPPRLLAALLAGHGVAGEEAVRLAARIIDWRDRDDVPMDGGAEAADYVAAGAAVVPRNAPFDTVEELGNVLGLAGWLVNRISQDITIHSAQAGVDPETAAPDLVARLQAGTSRLPSGDVPISEALPGEFVMRSARRVFTIRSAGWLPGGAAFVRDAVVEIGARRGRGYSIRAWRRGESAERPPADASLRPAC